MLFFIFLTLSISFLPSLMLFSFEFTPSLLTLFHPFSLSSHQLMSYIYDIPTLLRYLLRDLFTVNGLICMHRLHILAIFVLLLLYLFIPFDLLPESAIGLIGFIDDGLILLTVIIYVTLLYRSYVTNRAMNQ